MSEIRKYFVAWHCGGNEYGYFSADRSQIIEAYSAEDACCQVRVNERLGKRDYISSVRPATYIDINRAESEETVDA